MALSAIDKLTGGTKPQSNLGSLSSSKSAIDSLIAKPKVVNKTISPAPVQPTPVAPIKKPSAFSNFINKTAEQNLFTKAGQALNKATARPNYEATPPSTSAFKNTLRELPASLIETLLPGVKAVRDNEELASTITKKDLLKEVPGAVLATGQELAKAPISGALEVPNLITAGKYQPEISFNIPGLGEVSNSDFKIARRVEQGEDPLTAVIGEKSTGLLNALFTASLMAKPFMPRQVSVTGKVKAPEGIEVKAGPKSFRLYQPPTASKPLTPDFIAKMQADGVNLGPKFDPASPTYFRLSSSGMGDVYGEVIQIKPSYFNEFMRLFKGDTGAVPKTQVNVLNEQKVNVNEIKKTNVLENKNYKAPTVEQTIKGHIAEAQDVVDSGAGTPTDAIARAKINIVDGIKQLAPAESARIAKIDTAGMNSLTQFEQAVFAKTPPVTVPPILPIVKPSAIDKLVETVKPPVEKPKEVVVPELTPEFLEKYKAKYGQGYIDSGKQGGLEGASYHSEVIQKIMDEDGYSYSEARDIALEVMYKAEEVSETPSQESKTAPETKEISKPGQSLIEQAKKYKSAEELGMNVKESGHILDTLPKNKQIETLKIDSNLLGNKIGLDARNLQKQTTGKLTSNFWLKKIQNGERPPILVGVENGKLKVIDGNHRATAYLQENIKDVPVIFTKEAKSQLTDIWNKANQAPVIKSKRIGLMDYDKSYTPRMNQLIKEAQDNGDLFPYTKMTPEEQKIVDRALSGALSNMPMSKPETSTNAKTIAIDFIKDYVERGDTLKSLKDGQGGSSSSEYSVSIGGYANKKRVSSDKIVVTRMNGKDLAIPKIFSLKELYDEIKSQSVKTAEPEKVTHTMKTMSEGQELPKDLVEVPSTGSFNDFSYSPSTNSVYKTVNEKPNEMKLDTDTTSSYDFLNLRRLANEGNDARFNKDIKSLQRTFSKEIYAIYKAKYGEYPTGFITLSDYIGDWKKPVITYDLAQAETDNAENYEATTINEILDDLHALKNRGRSSEIIQSDIQYDVEGTRPEKNIPIQRQKSDRRSETAFDKYFKANYPEKKSTGLTLKPTEAKTEKEKEIEIEKVYPGLPPYKTLVNKTDIKTLIDKSPEFKANPVLTVDADKNLTFKGKMQEFKIKATAIGLNKENLKVGEKITVDTEALKAKGSSPQLRVYQGGSALADIGAFNNEIPLTAGKLETINPIELPEMVSLARELMGQAPRIKVRMGKKLGYFKGGGAGSVTLKADLFNPDVYTPDQVGKVLAHEIGHLVDYLPDQTLKRGNLLGRLLSLNDFRKNLFEDLMTSNKELRSEMYELSKEWRPFDDQKSSATYLQYRKSGKEIYADAISALLSTPGYVETKAPIFYKTFFDELDRKPQVRDAYFELQSLLSGDKEMLTAKRREGVKQMFDEGEYKSSELQAKREAEKKERLGSLFSRLKNDLVSKNYVVIDKVKQLEKQGIKINPDDNPVYYLEERNYIGGKIKAILARDFDPIYKSLNDAGITWEDFGEALFYKRIIDGDRSKVANPRGITPDVAKTLYEDVQKNLGDKFGVLEKSLTDFREGMMKVSEEAYTEGLYGKEMYDKMKENPTYATFQVIDHIEDGLSSKVYKSIGTLKDITNPATASIEKMIKTVQAIERNRTNKKTVDFLKTNFGDEIQTAKSVFAGKGKKFIESKKQGEELITFMRDGKAEGYYVDPYIARTLENESIGSNLALVHGLRFMNSHLYRPLFITYNLGFQSFNLIRDFTRFWKNVPGLSMWTALKRYKQATKLAKVRAFGLPENPTSADLEAEKLLETLEFDRVLSTTMNDMLAGESTQDKQIEKVFSKYGVNPINNLDGNAFVKAGKKLLEIVRQLGDYIETLPKVAGYYELASKGPITKEDASFIRRKLGSPDFLDGGYAKPITNEVFLFSNSILQGMRADLEVMTDPKTRSGYWWKTAKVTFLPKLLMWAAALGLFGKKVKDMMDSASEYDKTNYVIVPFGKDKNDKTVYLRLPQDETGRFLGGILWKTLGMGRNDQGIGKDLTDIISYTGGQIPSISPVIDSISATAQFVSGQNPYDYFRGRNIISDDAFNAGGWEAIKPFLGWQFQQMGGGIFGNFFNGSQTPVDKSIPEKVFTAPVVSNILGRFIRVSNYGKSEVYRQIADEYKKLDAQRRIEEKDIASEYAKQVSSGKMTAVEANNAMFTKTFGGEPKTEDDIAKAKRLQSRFNMNMIRGEQDPLVNAITYAVSNKEKTAILLKAKETMEINIFIDLLKSMYADKIIGDTVLEGLSNEK